SITFENIDIQERCFILSSLIDTPEFKRREGESFLEEKLVIDDQQAYEEFQKKISKARNMACKSVTFPSINFSQNTLLGNWAHGSCAAFGFKRTVSKDSEKRDILYSIKVQERDIACRGPGLKSLNMVTIPKLPKGYKVTFEPKTDHSGYQTLSLENGKTVARDWWGNIVPRRTSPPPGGGVFDVEIK
ncbi:MAG: hypothetical protein ACK470_01140, partial [Pseudanabaena sp.]